MDAKELILRCQKNDLKAQHKLYELYSAKVFSVCLKYSKNYEEAQDNLQEGFLLIFEKIHKYSFQGSLEGWIKRVVINYILQQYRSSTKFFELIDNVTVKEESEELETSDQDYSIDFLLKIIQELPDKYRLVFSLYVLDDYSHKEISEMLDISEGTSKSNLSRAKVLLKKKIEQAQDIDSNGYFIR